MEFNNKQILEIQNIVSVTNFNYSLNLKQIVLHARNAEYNPKRFPAVIMRIKQPKSTCGYSSGFIALADLTNKFNNINVFGMNWNFKKNKSHNGDWEKKIINKFCKKCKINLTSTNSYI